MNRWRAAWRWARRWLVIVFAGILFYEILEHFGLARNALREVLRVLRPLIVGFLLAYIVNIPSTLLQRTVFKKYEGKRFAIIISNILSYLFVLGLVVLLVFLIVPKAVDGVRMLFSNLGDYYNAVVNWATEFWNSLELSDEITERAIEISQNFASRIEGFAMEFLPRVINFTFSTVGKLTNVVLAIAFSVYALADKGKLLAHSRRFIRSVFSEKNAERILDVCSYANRAYRGYITGQLTSSTIIGILCYIGMRIFKMPYPEMISVFIAAFTDEVYINQHGFSFLPEVWSMNGINSEANNRTAMAPTGSTAPLRLPMRNERHLLLPSARIGIEIIAPSGTF